MMPGVRPDLDTRTFGGTFRDNESVIGSRATVASEIRDPRQSGEVRRPAMAGPGQMLPRMPVKLAHTINVLQVTRSS